MTVYDPTQTAPDATHAAHAVPAHPGPVVRHGTPGESEDGPARLPGVPGWATWALFGGIGAIVVGFVIGLIFGGLDYAAHGYLLAFAYGLSICLGGLFFVLLAHLFRAGWSVNLRRVPETLGATLPVVAIAFAPLLLLTIAGTGVPYVWGKYVAGPEVSHYGEHHGTGQLDGTHAETSTGGVSDVLTEQSRTADGSPLTDHPRTGAVPHTADDHGPTGSGLTAATDAATDAHADAHHGGHAKVIDDITYAKYPYLNPIFFTVRFLIYAAFWSVVGWWFWKTSVRQDADLDPDHTRRRESRSAPALLGFGVLLTFAAFDLLMSLDPHFYSTMYGVYYWVGSAVGGFATIIVILNLLQRAGYLRQSVGVEHYHDLGKFLFGAVFYWGYIAFSQYMLIWYASIPETTPWYARRGATTATVDGGLMSVSMGDVDPGTVVNPWSAVAAALLVGHLLIPFAGLLSRHVKRHLGFLTFWAVWLLIFHWLDLYWLIFPEISAGLTMIVPELLMTLGLLGVIAWRVVTLLSRADLRPTGDPRVEESLAFQNV